MRQIVIIALLFSSVLNALGQDLKTDSIGAILSSGEEDTLKVFRLLEVAKEQSNTDLDAAIQTSQKAKSLAAKIAFKKGEAEATKSIGIYYYFQSQNAKAIGFWEEAKLLYQEIGDSSGLANILSNLGAVFLGQGEYDRSMELYVEGQRIAEAIGDTKRIGTIMQNIGALRTEQGKDTLALEAFEKAAALFTSIKYWEGLGMAKLNIADIYIKAGDFEKAILTFESSLTDLKETPYYIASILDLGKAKIRNDDFEGGMADLNRAYVMCIQQSNFVDLHRILFYKGQAFADHGLQDSAIDNLERAKKLMLEEDQLNKTFRSTCGILVRLYSSRKDFEKAFENQKLFQQADDRLYSIESEKKIDAMLFNLEMEGKESEIKLLLKDQAINEISLKRQKTIRNALIGGFSLVLIFAAIFFVQRNRISIEREKSEELLLNILPFEVAQELKEKGKSEAQLVDQASVLFTDFQGFTSLAEKLSPQELVEDLDRCFSEFDRICARYKVEKIKTIGDAYMAVGGLPSPNPEHFKDVVLASLEMSAFIAQEKKRKGENGSSHFEVRIGVHTGPVVAGIVGLKKFQYDIWGDTVNIASRMESNAEIGKVNIGQSTYELLKSDPQFTFEYRGKIEVKGKGQMNMYYVDLA